MELEYENLPIEEVCRICLTRKLCMKPLDDYLVQFLTEITRTEVPTENSVVCIDCTQQTHKFYIFYQEVTNSFQLSQWIKKQMLVNKQKVLIAFKVENQSNLTQDIKPLLATGNENQIELRNELIAKECVKTEVDELDIKYSRHSPIDTNIFNKFLLDGTSLKESSVNKVFKESLIGKSPKEFLLDKNQKEPFLDVNPKEFLLDKNKKDSLLHKNPKESSLNRNAKQFTLDTNLNDSLLNRNVKDSISDRNIKGTILEKEFGKEFSLDKDSQPNRKPIDYLNDMLEVPLNDILELSSDSNYSEVDALKCKFCDDVFETSWLLYKHEREHEKETYFQCWKCNIKFKFAWTLASHVQNCNGAVKRTEKVREHEEAAKLYFVKCEECSEQFFTSNELREHGLKKHGRKINPKEYCCISCTSTFMRKNDIYMHSNVHRKIFNCNICDKDFRTKSYLENHKNYMHSTEDRFHCLTCGEEFTNRYKFNVHVRKHNNGYFICEFCGKSLMTLSNLKKHRMIHTGEDHRPFACPICAKKFKNKQHCKDHVQRHNKTAFNLKMFDKSDNKKGQSLTCETCGKNFKYRTVLERHRESHNNFRSYICELCGLSFKQFASFKSHKRKHEDPNWVFRQRRKCNENNENENNSFACEICNKSFSDKSKLKQHVNKHSDEKAFICKTCGKSFKWKASLNEHEMIHRGEKPFKCKYCDKSFLYKSSLFHHIGTHLEGKRFGCDICGNRYRFHTSLITHKKIHKIRGGSGIIQGNQVDQTNIGNEGECEVNFNESEVNFNENQVCFNQSQVSFNESQINLIKNGKICNKNRKTYNENQGNDEVTHVIDEVAKVNDEVTKVKEVTQVNDEETQGNDGNIIYYDDSQTVIDDNEIIVRDNNTINDSDQFIIEESQVLIEGNQIITDGNELSSIKIEEELIKNNFAADEMWRYCRN